MSSFLIVSIMYICTFKNIFRCIFIVFLISNIFCNISCFTDDKDQKKSQKVLTELENIDDECDNNNIAFVKIDNKKEALEYGIETMPCLVYFERRIPHIYEGILYVLLIL